MIFSCLLEGCSHNGKTTITEEGNTHHQRISQWGRGIATLWGGGKRAHFRWKPSFGSVDVLAEGLKKSGIQPEWGTRVARRDFIPQEVSVTGACELF